MKLERQQHILNASSNLLSVCFILITGLKLSRRDETTWLDEISLASAFIFLTSCLTSYLSMRVEKYVVLFERVADYLFITGLVSMFVAVAAFSKGLF